MSWSPRPWPLALFSLLALVGCGTEGSPPVDGGALPEAHVDDAPPPGWTCEARWWGEGWCDCGCGVVDVDCPDDEIESCVYNACQGNQRPDPWDTVTCEYNYRSCNPDHIYAEQLPRRHPLPMFKDPKE